MADKVAALPDLLKSPSQMRSHASLRRTLDGAKTVMRRFGNEDFTLADVCKEAGISVGSIYFRFESKENLTRAVLAEELRDIAEQERQILDRLKAHATDLEAFVTLYVEHFPVFLSENVSILRIAMERASHDELVAASGRAVGDQSADLTAAAFLTYDPEISGTRKLEKAHAAYRIIFAALARELGLGSTQESAHWKDWSAFKRELSAFALAYLRYAP